MIFIITTLTWPLPAVTLEDLHPPRFMLIIIMFITIITFTELTIWTVPRHPKMAGLVADTVRGGTKRMWELRWLVFCRHLPILQGLGMKSDNYQLSWSFFIAACPINILYILVSAYMPQMLFFELVPGVSGDSGELKRHEQKAEGEAEWRLDETIRPRQKPCGVSTRRCEEGRRR